MIRAQTKRTIHWTCPKCGEYNEMEDRWDKAISDELECDNDDCDYVDEWELVE